MPGLFASEACLAENRELLFVCGVLTNTFSIYSKAFNTYFNLPLSNQGERS
jgi:hypothetical protein